MLKEFYLLKLIPCLIFFFIALFVSSNDVFGVVYFQDNFESGNLNKWDYYDGYGSVSSSFRVDGGKMIGEVGRGESSFVYAKGFTGSDYTVELDAISVSGVDQQYMFRVAPDKNTHYLIDYRYLDQYWPQDCNNFSLFKYRNGVYYNLAEVKAPSVSPSVSLSQGVVHKIKIKLTGNKIETFFDGVLFLTFVDNDQIFPKIMSGGFGLRNWAGDYSARKVRNEFDNLVIYSGELTPDHNKIILIPGMGASWSPRAMVAGETVGADEWSMTPFVGNYDALIKAFEDNGLVKNTDFWVWNYDWRKPISETVTTFNTFVNSKVLAGEKVDLVGHSMGGLVASDWARINSSDARLNKVITLGSPHYGAVKAYEAWMGAQVSDKFDFGSIALKVLLTLNRGKDESELATVRRIAPSVKDLLPTFNYTKVGSRVIPVANLSAQNQWALSHSVLGPILTKLKTVVAIGQPTLEWLSLGEPSAYERKLGYWPDGKPISRSFGEGDATVLKKSALVSGAGLISLTSNHGSMVDGSINQVLAELGLGVTAVVTPVDYSASKLVFYLGSPATMAVMCAGMTAPVLDTDGWVVINSGPSQCQVNLTGTGTGGTYHLVTGRSDNDNLWQYFEEKIGVGETRNMILDTGKMQLTGSVGIDYLYGLIKGDNDLLLASYPGNIDLLALSGWVTARNETKLMESLFKFRKITKEMVVSPRIIDNLATILVLKNSSMSKATADVARKKATDLKLKVDINTRLLGGRKIYPSVFGSTSGVKAEKLLAVTGDNATIWANATMAYQLLGEVW
ncbi:MAG: family 16 glycoside hydrolase [Candidatus Shapirobacteria bacterium]